jgi:hypothetical protein
VTEVLEYQSVVPRIGATVKEKLTTVISPIKNVMHHSLPQ